MNRRLNPAPALPISLLAPVRGCATCSPAAMAVSPPEEGAPLGGVRKYVGLAPSTSPLKLLLLATATATGAPPLELEVVAVVVVVNPHTRFPGRAV
jgi:hypothetical protein